MIACAGVDIGCGMIAVRTPLRRSNLRDVAAVRAGIERRIPMSAGRNNPKLTASAATRVQVLERLAKERKATPQTNSTTSIGNLRWEPSAGGNHFIELAEDRDGAVWLTLHSGSRGVGNIFGMHYIKVAQELVEEDARAAARSRPRLRARGASGLQRDPRDLNWAQQFALHNRNEMMIRVLTELASRSTGRMVINRNSKSSASTHTITSRSRSVILVLMCG